MNLDGHASAMRRDQQRNALVVEYAKAVSRMMQVWEKLSEFTEPRYQSPRITLSHSEIRMLVETEKGDLMLSCAHIAQRHKCTAETVRRVFRRVQGGTL